MTVYKSIKAEAEAAAEVALRLFNGESIDDLTGGVTVVAFPNVYEQAPELIETDGDWSNYIGGDGSTEPGDRLVTKITERMKRWFDEL